MANLEILTRSKKGKELTSEEMDRNLLILDRREIIAGGNNLIVKVITIPISYNDMVNMVDSNEFILEVDLEVDSGAISQFTRGTFNILDNGSLYIAPKSIAIYEYPLTLVNDGNHIHVTVDLGNAGENDFLSKTMWYSETELTSQTYNVQVPEQAPGHV